MIRGITKPIDKEFNVSIHNRFDIEVIDSRTGKMRKRAQAFNVICDHFWDYIGTTDGNDWACGYIAYGSGSGTPLPSDTALFSQISYESVSHYKSGIDRIKGVAYYTCKTTLLETTAVGKTITEVGFLNYRYPRSLTTHAMLQDMNGNPLSITKTDTDIINIYATVYAHWEPGGYKGVYFLGDLDSASLLYNLLGRSYSRGARLFFSKGGGSPVYYGSDIATVTNDPSTKTLTWTATRLAAAAGNGRGFGWVYYGDYKHVGAYGFRENSLIKPTFLANVQGSYPIEGETVGTGDGATTEFSTSFDLPYDATVYVDGVAQTSGVTVKKEPLSLDPFRYLVQIEGSLTDEGEIIPSLKDPSLEKEKTYYFYNPLHEIGLSSYQRTNSSYRIASLAFSDDMVNWSPEYTNSSFTIPEQYKHSKYIRMFGSSSGGSSETIFGSYSQCELSFPSTVTGKNIVFDEPPAVGSVITIDYTTPMVPKDSNHVYDFKVVFHYGEYSAEQG